MVLLHPLAHPYQLSLVISAVALFWSCGGSGSSPPPGGGTQNPPPPGTTRVTGSERLAWTQPGSTANVSFRVYIDDSRTDLPGASCDAPNDAGCSAPLPSMANGVHNLYLTAVDPFGNESATSEVLRVEKVTATGATVTAAGLPDASAGSVGVEAIVTTPDGQTFGANAVARALLPPLQLAATPDGRLLVAEADGLVRMMHPGAPERDSVALDTRALLDGTSVGVPGLAVHPDFADSRLVYAALVSSDADGQRLRIVRLREAGGTLGEPATIFEAPVVERVPVLGTRAVDGDAPSRLPQETGVRLAFGPDRLLYALLPPGAEFDREPAASRPLASIVRIDEAGRVSESGAVSGLGAYPLGLAWNPQTDDLLTVMPSANGTAGIASIGRRAEGVAAPLTPAFILEPRIDRDSPARLRIVPGGEDAARLARAVIEGLQSGRSAAIRFTVPVTLDGWPGGFAGEVLDVVAAGGTVYAAVTDAASSGVTGARTGLVVRLRPR